MKTIQTILNEAELKHFLESNKNNHVLVDLYADWCGPCQVMMPVFTNVVNETTLPSAKLNADFVKEYLREQNVPISTIPRFYVMKIDADGNIAEAHDFGGTQSKTALLEKVKPFESMQPVQDSAVDTPTEHVAHEPNVAVIGSGPSGYTAAIYTSRANVKTTIYTGSQPGGQLTTTTEIENFPGFPVGIMGPELMSNMQKQAERFGSKVEYEEVSGINVLGEGKGFDVQVGSQSHHYDAVIIASGAKARYLGLPNEEKWVGKGYHTCATCDGFFYKDKEVAIVGGGDSAMEEANYLTKHATKVYLIHRHDQFKASKIMLERAQKNPKIEFLMFKETTDFIIEDEKFKGIILKDTKSGESTNLLIDGLFVAIGHIPNTDFVQGLLSMDEVGYLLPKTRTMSEIPGIFIAGDVEDTVYRQAITAAGDGCKAAMDCEKWLEAQES